MVTAVKTVPASTLHGIQTTARAFTTVAQGGTELSSSAQVLYIIYIHKSILKVNAEKWYLMAQRQ